MASGSSDDPSNQPSRDPFGIAIEVWLDVGDSNDDVMALSDQLTEDIHSEITVALDEVLGVVPSHARFSISLREGSLWAIIKIDPETILAALVVFGGVYRGVEALATIGKKLHWICSAGVVKAVAKYVKVTVKSSEVYVGEALVIADKVSCYQMTSSEGLSQLFALLRRYYDDKERKRIEEIVERWLEIQEENERRSNE